MDSEAAIKNSSEPYWSHWWALPEKDDFRQGDLVRGLTVFWLPTDLPTPEGLAAEGTEAKVRVRRYRGDWIIATASCDLDAKGFPQLLLLPVYRADEDGFRISGGKNLQYAYEAARRGLHPRHFMLAEHPELDPPLPISFAEFANLALVPTEYVRRCVAPNARLRLKHPYREKFGNWVGSRFSAVGPEDVGKLPSQGGMHDKYLIDTVEEE